MSAILSTKALSPAQRALVSGHRLIERDFIRTTHYPTADFKHVMAAGVPAVFSSQNAVRAVAPLIALRKDDFKQLFCVGEKTALALAECGVHPDLVSLHAEGLAAEILKVKGLDSLNYFCGRLHRPELPDILKKAYIRLFEVVVYDTVHTPQIVEEPFEIALFYSPSGVESFLRCNVLSESQTAITIGRTTAAYLERFHRNTVVVAEPNIEHVLLKALEILR